MKAKYLAPLLILGGLLFFSCGTSPRKAAREARERGEYYRAEQAYRQLYRQTPQRKRGQRAELAQAEGLMALAGRRYPQALSALRRAVTLGLRDSSTLLHLAQVQLSAGNYAEAQRLADSLLPGSSDSSRWQWIRSSAALGLRGEASQRGMRYVVAPFAPTTSTRSDYGIAFSADGGTLLFGSSRRDRWTKQTTSDVTGEPLTRLYQLSRGADGRWSPRVDSLMLARTPEQEQGTPSLSPDGRYLYYSGMVRLADGRTTIKIHRSERSEQGGWSRGEALQLFGDSLTLEAHPSLSPSGQSLFFVSNYGSRAGKTSIYRASLQGLEVGAPVALGPEVNTSGQESYPYAASDSVLYFASDGHPGLGGLDIYRASLLPSGRYEVVHMPAPINSPSDDFGFVLAPDTKRWSADSLQLAEAGLFATNRRDASGRAHLYRFALPERTTTIEGYVTDREGYALPGATVRMVGRTATDQVQVATTDAAGAFRLRAEADISYVLLASHSGYLNQYVRLHTEQTEESDVYTITFSLASRERAEQLREVYYAFDRAEFLPASLPMLQSLVTLLRDNPDIRLRLSAHADRHGADAYNERLSRARAESVVRYLVSQGIAADRLISEGYGKSRPFVVTARVAEEHPFLPEGQTLDETFIHSLQSTEQQEVCDQLNRRTEFEVLP